MPDSVPPASLANFIVYCECWGDKDGVVAQFIVGWYNTPPAPETKARWQDVCQITDLNILTDKDHALRETETAVYFFILKNYVALIWLEQFQAITVLI